MRLGFEGIVPDTCWLQLLKSDSSTAPEALAILTFRPYLVHTVCCVMSDI